MPNIGLTENSRTEMANALQKLLADEYILYTKTLNFHWNVEGKHFGPLHALFNDQYEKLQSIIDNIAERIRAIGMFTHATMREFLSMSSLTEKVNDFPDDIRMLSILLADHESVIQTIRNANDFAAKINDGGSNNFLSGLLETHEKMAWMLRAHLNK
ncbi:DNA starvation/stationary phase protection protein [Candidatus Dependentiae bacterium]|nr:MAG: DNA starvation/stationary phase protection protein [Candidatus Dependentiae bacterium]